MDAEEKEIREQLRDVFVCKICGMPKTHHRLYGYRCSINPEHDDMENERDYEARNLRRRATKERLAKRGIKIEW